MSAEAVMIWRLAPAPDYTGPCHICGETSAPYDEMAWTTDQESLHRQREDDEALLRLYTAEARRQARGDWRVYQRLHACHRCMVDYNTQALANDKAHDPATLRALFQGVDKTGRCAIMWMLYDPQDHTKQQPMLGSGPLSASLHECRAALIDTMLSTPSGGEAECDRGGNPVLTARPGHQGDGSGRAYGHGHPPASLRASLALFGYAAYRPLP